MTHLGRNDPCHCGSGKKYKKCHLDADQRRHWQVPRPMADPVDTHATAVPSASLDFKTLPDRLRQLFRNGPAKERKEFAQLLSATEPLLQYMSRREEIGAAGEALEAHREAFVELAQDGSRYSALARVVFAEECFAPLRFTAADVKRAFDHVGQPALMSPDDRTVQTLRAAILHLSDPERRTVLSLGLMSHLPDFVGAGRYLEGWLVQSLAIETADNHGDSNAFLFQMFCFGFDAWTAEKQGSEEALLRKLGIDVDRLRGMSPDEMDSWIQSHTSDPAKTAVLEALFRDNQHLREESVANLQAMERNSAKLLEREDSRFLLLPGEDVQPWIARFNERLAQSGFSPPTQGDASSEDDLGRMFEELALPLTREMAEAVFTRDRILQLIASLKEYRNDLFAEDDKMASQHAMGAIRYLEGEDSPGLNSFLVALCWRSLDAAITAYTPDHGQPSE